MIHESSCEREINVNEGIHARLINSVSCVPRVMNKLPGFETKPQLIRVAGMHVEGGGENIRKMRVFESIRPNRIAI